MRAAHHATVRWINRKLIFRDDTDRRRVLLWNTSGGLVAFVMNRFC
jgi:hypothetical protein